MMNKYKTIAIAAAMLPVLTGFAALEGLTSDQSVIGYTTTDEITYNNVAFGAEGSYTVGAIMPATMLEDFKGCKVIGIRVAAGQDLGRTSVMLNKNTAEGVEELHLQKQRLYSGWNNVFFNGFEYEITGEEELFCGFVYNETAEMVSADTGALCSTGDYDVTNSFVWYDNGKYAQLTGARNLCVQMIVDITNMPQQRMSLGFFDTGFKYKKAGEVLEIFTHVSNNGRDVVNNFRLACRIDENEPFYVNVDEKLEYGQSTTVNEKFDISDVKLGGHQLTIYVDQINGEAYADGLNRSKGAKFAIYDTSLDRNKAYVEVYADQRDSYTALLDNSLTEAKSLLGEEMILVKNFRPGNTLAVEEGGYLHDLYAYTWPSFTVNRSHFPGEAHVAYDVNQYLDQLAILVPTIIEDLVRQDIETPSFAGINLDAVLNDGYQLTVKADGEILPVARSIYGDLALTLMLIEDNVSCTQEGNQSSKRYKHSDVLRSYLTPATGVVIDSTKDKYEQEITVTIPEDFNPDNLAVVGILTQSGTPTPDTLYDYDVINAGKTSVDNRMSGIEDIVCDTELLEPVYYNLNGERVPVSELGKGIYIRVDINGNRSKIIR